MKLLMVAADPMEYPGILAHATGARPAAVAVDWSRTAKLGSHDALLVANGAGALRAAAAVDAALPVFRPDAVVSTGFCGALSPDLEIADVIAGTRVLGENGSWPALPVQSAIRHKHGSIRCIDHVAQTADEKRSLGAEGAIAVEMEAAGVAERAQKQGFPFYCVRVVTDLSGETLSNDFNKALRSDGHFDTILILRGSLRHPLVRVPELIRLRKRCVRAARVLGDFFANCRF
jgi:adenosylhomocysteine nucleosidase